jgi:hypothetical protein
MNPTRMLHPMHEVEHSVLTLIRSLHLQQTGI